MLLPNSNKCARAFTSAPLMNEILLAVSPHFDFPPNRRTSLPCSHLPHYSLNVSLVGSSRKLAEQASFRWKPLVQVFTLLIVAFILLLLPTVINVALCVAAIKTQWEHFNKLCCGWFFKINMQMKLVHNIYSTGFLFGPPAFRPTFPNFDHLMMLSLLSCFFLLSVASVRGRDDQLLVSLGDWI